MMPRRSFECLLLVLLASGCDTSETAPPAITPPVAPVQPVTRQVGDRELVDPYAWLEAGPADAGVRAVIAAEQRYLDAVLAPAAALERELTREIARRERPAEQSVPVAFNGYHYYREFRPGSAYPYYLRQPDNGAAEVMLDVNHLAGGDVYFDLGNWAVSPDGRWLAFVSDNVGNGQYVLHLKDLASGQVLAASRAGVSRSLAFNDDGGLFYIALDAQTQRPDRVYRHEPGSAFADDVLIFVEQDPAFHVRVTGEQGAGAVQVISESPNATAINLVTESRAVPFASRREAHRYSLRHAGDSWLALSNHEYPDFALYRVDAGEAPDSWQRLYDPQAAVLVDFTLIGEHAVIAERAGGASRLRVLSLAGEPGWLIESPDETGTLTLFANPSQDADHVRFALESLRTPPTIIDVDLATHERQVRQVLAPAGRFAASDYEEERLWFEADDGTEVPVSLVYHRERFIPGESPALLYAYGAYGLVNGTHFSADRLSLLDRGVLFAVVHVRGGGLLGSAWHEAGQRLNKSTSVADFIKARDYLQLEGWLNPAQVFARGGSAGGTLVAILANRAGDQYRGLIADVPFVDLVNTLADESAPLTATDRFEWGSPLVTAELDNLVALSPYEQVAPQSYPNLLVTAGLNDLRVPIHEPLKWVARLRANQRGTGGLMIDIDSESGHGGATDSLARHRREARRQAFLLHLARQDL